MREFEVKKEVTRRSLDALVDVAARLEREFIIFMQVGPKGSIEKEDDRYKSIEQDAIAIRSLWLMCPEPLRERVKETSDLLFNVVRAGGQAPTEISFEAFPKAKETLVAVRAAIAAYIDKHNMLCEE